ncbi:MAG: dihydropteroate synthase [Pseudomonadota bacterium]
MARGEADEVLPAEAVSTVHPALRDTMARLMAGDRALRRGPEIMAIVNVTPDSFSDGGTHAAPDRAAAFARKAIRHGATIIDIGGESTRPGAEPVTPAAEIARVVPALHAIRAMMVAEGVAATLSIDTRNAPVAAAALDAGATLLNDVSALTHDPAMAEVAPRFDQVCLMHAQGDPQTMQRDPRYADVVLDVYDYLEQRIAAAEALGIARHRLIADPGIGFGKTIDHNLALLDALSLFHGLGTRLLLGASRKRFIGTLAEGTDTGHSADDRAAGSVSAALWGVAQGVQVMRVHDTAETAQALAVWTALATVAPRAASAATAPAATEGHAAAVAVTTDEGALR